LIEKIFILQDADPMVFYGVNNANLRMLRALFSKLRIVGRGSVLKVIGNPEDIAEFDVVYEAIYRHCVNYNKLIEEDIVTLIQGRSNEQLDKEGVIVYSTSGKPILARSQNQQKLVDAYKKDDLLFCIGPAGTGKTYTAIALAVRALKNKEVKKIILSRPAGGGGGKGGVLPGGMCGKGGASFPTLYDALQEMLPAAKLQEYLDTSVIQIAPLAFMRGRTLNDAVVILDEAQNTTRAQLKMFLTRMGMNTKMIVTGDITQIDLPRMQQSGLIEAIRILRHIQGISFVEMDKSDIVRHKLVARIVKAYEQTTHTKDDASTTEEQQQISEECYSNN